MRAPRWVAAVAFGGALLSACSRKDSHDAPSSTHLEARSTTPAASASTPPVASASGVGIGDDTAKTEAASRSVTLLFGGDVNLARGCGQRILADKSYAPLRHLQPLFAAADLRFVNLESQLSDQNGETQSPRNHLVFTGPPGGATVLKRAGVDVVSVANNHMWDYGRAAFLETLAHLRRADVAYVGASADAGAAFTPLSRTIRGVRVAIFAVTGIWNQGPLHRHAARAHVAGADAARVAQAIASTRDEHDIVVVSYHGGEEYKPMPVEATRAFVRAVMAAGADAVVGHHPHVPRGVGWFGTRPAFYSLGNLVFAAHSGHEWTQVGLLARMRISQRAGRHEVQHAVCPVRIGGHMPRLLLPSAREHQRVRRHLSAISKSVGGTVLGAASSVDGCINVTPPPSPPGWWRRENGKRPKRR